MTDDPASLEAWAGLGLASEGLGRANDAAQCSRMVDRLAATALAAAGADLANQQSVAGSAERVSQGERATAVIEQ